MAVEETAKGCAMLKIKGEDQVKGCHGFPIKPHPMLNIGADVKASRAGTEGLLVQVDMVWSESTARMQTAQMGVRVLLRPFPFVERLLTGCQHSCCACQYFFVLLRSHKVVLGVIVLECVPPPRLLVTVPAHFHPLHTSGTHFESQAGARVRSSRQAAGGRGPQCVGMAHDCRGRSHAQAGNQRPFHKDLLEPYFSVLHKLSDYTQAARQIVHSCVKHHIRI